MSTSPGISIRLLLAGIAWLFLTGDAIISCSSDPGNLGPGNRPPVAADSFYTVGADESVTGFMRATDPDGDALTFRIVTVPRLGVLRDVDSATGQFTYVPDQTGTDSFSFRARDRIYESNIGVVTIQVTEAPGGGLAQVTSGARKVVADPLNPGSLLVLWDDAGGTLQRIFPNQPVEAEILARGLLSFQVDPSIPGRMLAMGNDAVSLLSKDGGRHWTSDTRADNARASKDCFSGGTGDDTECPVLPEGILPSGAGSNSPMGVSPDISMLPDAFHAGGWWLAIGGPATDIYYTPDGGLDWEPVLHLKEPGLRLMRCDPGAVCLLSASGTEFWRFATGR